LADLAELPQELAAIFGFAEQQFYAAGKRRDVMHRVG
jgi:hypothetical protein